MNRSKYIAVAAAAAMALTMAGCGFSGGDVVECDTDSDGNTDTYCDINNCDTTANFYTGTKDDRKEDCTGEIYLSYQ